MWWMSKGLYLNEKNSLIWDGRETLIYYQSVGGWSKIKPYVYEIKRALSKYTIVINKKLEAEEKTVTDDFFVINVRFIYNEIEIGGSLWKSYL